MNEQDEELQPRPPCARPPSLRRFLWLLACMAVGMTVGFAGFHFTADQAWFLAVPIALAAGWLIFANPDQCMPPRK